MYRLKAKEPDFTVVDGKFANHTYRAGQTYAEIPPEEINKFDRVEEEKPVKSLKVERKEGETK